MNLEKNLELGGGKKTYNQFILGISCTRNGTVITKIEQSKPVYL